MADRKASPKAKTKMMAFNVSHDALSAHDKYEVYKIWTGHMDTLAADIDVGTEKPMTALGKVKLNWFYEWFVLSDYLMESLIQMKKVATKITIELQLKPSEFDLS
ncbi:MAG: hypothetical protein P1U35_12600 [Cycloclasticus sp.]|nr:hypothetical protein [Cycloclasticus sp.]